MVNAQRNSYGVPWTTYHWSANELTKNAFREVGPAMGLMSTKPSVNGTKEANGVRSPTPANPTEDQAKKDLANEVASPWKPQTKTALGRLNYHFATLPRLYVIEVQTVSLDKPETKVPILSRKLRALAIKEFFENDTFKSIVSLIAINLRGGGKHYDHVIIPLQHEDHRKHVEELLKSQELTLAIQKKYVKVPVEASNGSKYKVTEVPVIVATKSGGVLQSEPKSKKNPKRAQAQIDFYWRSLDVLIRSYASRSLGIDSLYGISNEFKGDLVGKVRGYAVRIRNRPLLDRNAATLRLDFDLAPYIPNKPVCEILVGLFGSTILGPDATAHLLQLRQTLLGLRVTKVRSDSIGSINARLALDQDASILIAPAPQSERNHSYQIQEIRMPGEVEPFQKDGKTYSVHEYFNRVVLPDGQQLKYPGLPLANLGKNCWVPLERLVVDYEQPLAHSNHLTTEIQALVQNWMKERGLQKLRDLGSTFFNSFNNVQFDDATEEITELIGVYDTLPILPAKRCIRLTAYKPPKKNKQPESKSSTVGIIYIKPPHDIQGDSEIVDIASQQLPLSQSHLKVILNLSITSEKELVTVRMIEMQLIQLKTTPDLIIGIIDEEGRTREQVRNVATALHNLGEQRLGSVVVTTTAQNLRSRFVSHRKGLLTEETVLDKINFMLGGRNYASTPLPPASENIMIVGAHIAHPDAKALPHCPSVASVVATKDRTALHYPGSARVQQTTNKVEKTTKVVQSDSERKHTILKFNTENSILDLKAMMEERFAGWSAKDPLPTSVVFYRDGITFDDSAISAECSAIRAAYRDCRRSTSELKLTYIVVNKNSQIPQDFKTGRVRPNFGFMAEDADVEIPRYQYYVHDNDDNFSRAYLRELTLSINGSSQLTSQQVNASYALPVKYANKLCSRMFDYFRFFITRDLGAVPSVLDVTSDSDYVKRDLQMVQFAKAYLAIEEKPAKTSKQTHTNGSAEDASHTNGDASHTNGVDPKETGKHRALPWVKKLDDTMFYL